MTIRVGLIGAGIMGADHAKILSRDLPGVTLQYVCDADGLRAKSVADANGAIHAVTDPLAVIAGKDVDAVLIASPDHTHAALTKACIELGKPVLCEKPLSPNSAECLDVIAAEVKAGRRLVQVGFMRRFDPAYVEMKAALDRWRHRPGADDAQFPSQCVGPIEFHRTDGDHQFSAPRVRHRPLCSGYGV